MFGSYINNGSDVFRCHVTILPVTLRSCDKSGCVINILFWVHLRISVAFDGEIVSRFISRLVSPISSLFLGLCFHVLFTDSAQFFLQDDSASQEIPIEISIQGDKSNCSPEDPTHFSNHPDISLSHIVGHMKYHGSKIKVLN